MLKGKRQQVTLENAQHDRRVARVLHDLLPAAIFPRQPAELRNHRRQQLHHDRRADVRHDPERKDRAVFQRAAAEQIKQRGDRPPPVRWLSEVRNHSCKTRLIDARRRDRSAQTHNHDHGQRKQNPPAQLRYLDVFRNAEIIR